MHELGLRFNTPTVNLCCSAEDFMKFCSSTKYYLSQEMRETTLPDVDYPVGLLGSEDREITIHFMHYDTFQQAKEKWDKRAMRIHWDNMFFIMTDTRAQCSQTTAEEFDALPYKHKVLLTYRDFPGIKSAVKLDPHGVPATGNWEFPSFMSYLSPYSLRRIIDDWDYVGFLNS